ncbi:MAG: hypothetical protein NTY88_02155 [Bacteroidetes bacterium]|nr:hypothetical protein [Bacteroidota bacterium]
MARTTGSNELYRLIHSLTVEEKGYFKKFATRHSSEGGKYLQLFDAINKQTVFEEKSLIKKFKSYAFMKVYLKETIVESMLLYYRHQNQQIDLLTQIQKVHFLLMKGMQDEALKILRKCIKETKRIEAFEMSRYLQRLQMNLLLKTVPDAQLYEQLAKDYENNMNDIGKLEDDLLQWEVRSLTILPSTKKADVFNTKSQDDLIQVINKTGSASQQSKILKQQVLYELYRSEMNQQNLMTAAEQYFFSVETFKRDFNSEYNDIPAINNYLYSLATYNRFKEVIAFCNKTLLQPRQNQNQYQQLLVRCIIFKTSALVHLGKFQEALEYTEQMEKSFHSAALTTKDTVRQNVFMLKKIIVLFLNKHYRETWLDIQNIQQKKALERLAVDFADLKMVELMTQFMLGNFDLVKAMAAKVRREFSKNKIQSTTYDMLLTFFSKTSPATYKQEAKKIFQQLNEYYTINKKFHRKAFAMIRYTYWLEEISGGRTMQQGLQEQFGGK